MTRTATLAIGLWLAAGTAMAQEASVTDACRGDYLQYCSNTKPGTPQVRACFRAHKDQLSTGCAAAILAVMRRTGKEP